MNGNQHMRPSFQLPASHNTTQARWDLAFLTVKEFKKKYGAAAYKYLVQDLKWTK